MLNKQGILRLLLIFSLVVVVSACGEYQRLLKSTDHELKFEKAIEYYEDEQYGRTIGLLTDIIPVYRGTAKAETINYYYAMSHYKQGDYLLASHYFKSFANAFPRSEHAEEFLYLSAYCQYLLSPRPSLDQTPTREAIRELQSYINRYPHSERVEEANQLIDELRLKLEKKQFRTARLYYDLSQYTAAATSFETLIKDFPDTEFREEAMFYIVRSYFDFAERSIVARQVERFEKAIEAYRRLERFYPESEYLPRAKSMKEAALATIQELRPTEEISDKN